MNVYSASFYEPSGCGCCSGDSNECIVVADSESEALGLILERFDHTEARYWDLTFIDITTKGVIEYD